MAYCKNIAPYDYKPRIRNFKKQFQWSQQKSQGKNNVFPSRLDYLFKSMSAIWVLEMPSNYAHPEVK